MKKKTKKKTKKKKTKKTNDESLYLVIFDNEGNPRGRVRFL
jgi:hypothetical protein